VYLHLPRGKCASEQSFERYGEYNHEEADIKILAHIKDAISKGAKNVLVLTVETDVIVLLVGHWHELKALQSSLLVWVAFGMGKSLRQYSI